MIPPNLSRLTGPKKSTTDFVVPHSPALAHTQTHMGSQIMLRGERPLLSPVTLKDPSKAPLDELSNKRSPIKSRMSWPESRTSKTLKIQGWWTCGPEFMSLELEVAAYDGFQRVSPCNPRLERAWMRPWKGNEGKVTLRHGK